MTTKPKTKQRILVYGARGHAKVVIDIVERAAVAKIAFLVDDDPQIKGSRLFDYSVLGGMNDLEAWLARNRAISAIVAIGDNATRMRIAATLKRKGLTLTCAVHPAACIGRGVAIGAGTVIMGGCVVNPDTIVGDNTIVNTGSTIDHDCTIGDGVHVAPGCHLCGDVTVGAGSFLGAGTTVIPGVRIGANTVIGAGSTVLNDVADGARVAGSPCRPVAS